MAGDEELWKWDPDMPRIFLEVCDVEHQRIWGNTYRTSYDIQKHIDARIEEARARGKVLLVRLEFVDPTEAGFRPVTPEEELGELEEQAPGKS